MTGGKQKQLIINYHILHTKADGGVAGSDQEGRGFQPDETPRLVLEFRGKLRELQDQIERCKDDFSSKVEAYSELNAAIDLLQNPDRYTPEQRRKLIIWLEGFMHGTSKVMTLANKTRQMDALLDWLDDYAGAVLKLYNES